MIKSKEDSKQEKIYMERTLVQVTVLFTLGIFLGFYTNIPFLFSFILLMGLFLFSIYCFLEKVPYRKIVLFCCIIVFGLFWFDLSDPHPGVLKQWENQKVEITGKVLATGLKNNQYLFQLKTVNGQDLTFKPKIVVNIWGKDNQEYGWNDMVKFTGLVEELLPSTNPGGFSEKEYWRQKGAYYELNTWEKGFLMEKGRGLKSFAFKLREKINQIIATNLPEKEGGVVRGLILGDKKALDPDLYDQAQKLGIVHIFAVSGLHVGFIAALIIFMAGLFNLSNTIIVLIVSAVLLVYSFITGLTPSVVRASIMAILGLIGLKGLKYKDFYTLLAGAALVILFVEPLNILSIGFQLSFISTWGLVYCYPLAQEFLFFLPEKIRKILAVPLASQLSSLPLVIYHFNLLSFWAPLANIIIVPLVSILVPLLFLALTVSLITVKVAEPFLILASGIVYGLFLLIQFIKDIVSSGFMYIEKPSPGLIILYFLFLIGCREVQWLKEKISLNKRTAFSIMLIIILLFITLPGPQSLKAVFLDVGQGDGAVLKTPHNQYIVVDGGPSPSTLARYLQYIGANRISLVILSHPDGDHINGLFQVIENFSVDLLMVPPEFEKSSNFTKLKELARKNNTRIIEGVKGMSLKMPSGIKLKVFSPDPYTQEKLDTNEGSLVVNLNWREKDILFTGDVGITTMKKILADIEEIEVIKVPHHGSKNSYFPGLYSFLSPDIAVISAGRNNRYNHPHLEVLQGLEKAGVVILRTDENGALSLLIQEDDIVVDTKL